MSAFSVENSHDGKIFENYTRFEWGVELGVVAIFMLRLFVPHEFDMNTNIIITTTTTTRSLHFSQKRNYNETRKMIKMNGQNKQSCIILETGVRFSS